MPVVAKNSTLITKKNQYDYLTKPIVANWTGFLSRGKEARREFDTIAEQCRSFYAKASTFMWEPQFLQKYVGKNIDQPKFQITFNKAFEYVSIFTPMLFWQYASRKVAPYDSLKLNLLDFAEGNEEASAFLQAMSEEQDKAEARNKMRAAIMQHYLNYSQREQPGGGLTTASTLALSDALLTGRGCTWTQAYSFPESNRTLTGNFWVSVDDILIDPDCLDITLLDARWIARRHVNHRWQVEDMFGYEPGKLSSSSTMYSNNAQAFTNGKTFASQSHNRKTTGDLIEWWEVYSKAGFGNKLGGNNKTVERSIDPMFDEQFGDNIYLCIAPCVPHPLNIPSENFDMLTVDDLREATRWPTEFWRDYTWPLNNLDFYTRNTTDPWPLAPLSPALGEMTALNILVAGYIQGCYENRQTLIAYLEGAVENIDKVIASSASPLPIAVRPDLQKSVNDLIGFIKRPESNGDPLKGIEFLLQRVSEITGLNELLYGGNPGGAVSRSAEDARAKQSNTSIRPDYMGKRVAEWQTMMADKEKIAAYYHVKASDISELLGPVGVEAWVNLIENEKPESVLRNMHCYIEASEIRKPDRARDYANLQQITQTIIPVLAAHATQTGDYEPLNQFMAQLGQTMEMDLSSFRIPSQPPPEPDPEAAVLQKQLLVSQIEELQAKVEKLLADAEKSRVETMSADPETQFAAKLQDMEIKQADADSKLQARQAELMLKAAAAEQAMGAAQEKNELQLAAQMESDRLKIASSASSHLQSLDHADEIHQQTLDSNEERSRQQIRHANMMAFTKLINAGQSAAVNRSNRNNPQIGNN